ncbi:hypothetical protein [Mycobacterium sp. TY814]|uniref:hypothetical protein n=1 Tax=Mycobacterium sp. TY814 TaxID=3050580 RepID=UPI002740B0FA|nr:hypothetical protein [Mycobacterium sp. TY814]MDP7721829.1 hypothetical protein [Mycobacterium sp. TY814]
MTDTDTDARFYDDEDTEPGSSLELLPPARLPDMGAITTLREHVGAMREAKFFAEGMCYTALVPDRFRGKPGDGAAAILFGAEIGLSPIAALRSVIVIHGQPGLEARTMKALLKSKGYRFQTHESTDEACDIEAWSPDGSESERCRFTMADAVKAQYVPVEVKPGEYKKNSNGKLQGNMKYITEPRTMLRAKATAVVCREIAPHILLGMPYSADELATEESVSESAPPVRVVSQRQRRGVEGLREAINVDVEPEPTVVTESPEPEQVSDPDPQEPKVAAAGYDMAPATRRKWLNRMFQLLGQGDCTDEADQRIVIAALAGKPVGQLEHRDGVDDDQLRAVVNKLNEYDKKNRLGAEITEILNTATLAEANVESGEQQTLDGTN